ncbi:ABC transporter substrate-binding protein [Mongoliibacter ruber]|uniref:Iron complex transport system substrate-binding protein n=1 Tax=Mongoliibacter ruber TaxID=1750599 RepID=A0A2T0WF31_9BACT|nr:ABC transporter substrate-binding protein [Mongoliibacter ruber]PRY85317.1 iron complex transport system substrate-binding protein [Mongoliibacter ruber]
MNFRFRLKLILFTLLLPSFFSCGEKEKDDIQDLKEIQLSYSTGFSIFQGDGFKIIEVKKGYPNQKTPIRYWVNEGHDHLPNIGDFEALIPAFPQKIILTSTTQVPHLDYLDLSQNLIGFPNLDLISSEKTRDRIENGMVEDLGSGAQANIERMIDLEPDLVVISTLGEDMRNLEILKKAGIPAVLNGEYVEQHPLGRAEWIKFTGALTGKYEEALAIFEEIEAAYLQAEQLASDIGQKPTVLSGIMYKDIWYVPGSDSWGARLLEAAGGQYLFEEQKGSGSAQLNFEYVLEKAQDAAFWIGAADHANLQEMKNADPRYAHFSSFQHGNVYTYSQKKGPTGGLEYFELGYLRPDLILKDLIKILHPELMEDYQSYFYQKLDEA